MFYVEHARHLFPEPGEGDDEENNLLAAMFPGTYIVEASLRGHHLTRDSCLLSRHILHRGTWAFNSSS